MHNEQTTAQMRMHLENIRNRVSREEELYELRGTRLEERSQRTTSTYSDMSGALSLVTEARELTRNLYSALTGGLLSLDQLCRPLLAQDPDPAAIKEVADYIAYLNSEAGSLGANFSATIDGTSAGDIATTRFTVSPEAMGIESFWQATYDATPEAQAEARRREEMRILMEQRRADAKKARENEAENIREQTKQILARKEALTKRCNAAAAEYRNQLFLLRKERLAAVQTRLEEEADTLRRDKADAEVKLSGLGLFAFAEKKALRERIEQYTRLLNNYVADGVRTWDNEYTYAANQAEQAYRDQLTAHVDACYSEDGFFLFGGPLNASSSVAEANMAIKTAIVRVFLENGNRMLTITDMMEASTELGQYSSTRISAVIRQMVPDVLLREEIKRRAYFQLANDDLDSIAVRRYKENTALAEGDLPAPAKAPAAVYDAVAQNNDI